MKGSVVASIVVALVFTGCASLLYERVDKGELRGRLIVEWIEPDRFIFRPDKDNPLTFVRKTNQEIRPGAMYTDGGSVPRPLWAIKNYSPWGYGPAFVVHDWLFHAKECKLLGYDQYTFEDSARIMAEVMKTLMERYGGDSIDKTTLYAMHEAVSSPIAKHAWESGECRTPLAGPLLGAPKVVYVLDFN